MKRKRAYRASKYHSDMERYSGVTPIETQAGFVFIKPNMLNYNWIKMGVGRTRSFGIAAQPGWWDGEKFIVDENPARGY